MTVPDSVIRRLSDLVIDQIAAGEVIERPASVLKELLENAIDAGAAAIDVDIAGGGLERIAVTDDGCGMSAADARLCLERHATSKLAAAVDLDSIRTLGFRGEALSSIASVSRLTLTTRRPSDNAATRLIVEGGEVLEAGEVGAPPGTTVEVTDLFFNTPARKKFMRSPATEQTHCTESALRVGLGCTEAVGLVLRASGRRLLDLSATASAAQRAVVALGRRVERVFGVAYEGDGVSIAGQVAEPAVDRGDPRGLWFFVNDRYVRDRMLYRAALDAFGPALGTRRYPMAVVHIGVEPSAVDVNVHPQKLEVRFRDAGAVFRAVGAALALLVNEAPWLDDSARDRSVDRRFRSGESLGGDVERMVARTRDQPRREITFLARVGNHWVCSENEGLLVIDLAAATTRLAVNAMLGQLEVGRVESQRLLLPPILSAGEPAALEGHADVIERLGFEIEPVGPGRAALRAVPAALIGADPAALVDALLANLNHDIEIIVEACAAHAPTHVDISRTQLGELVERVEAVAPAALVRLSEAKLAGLF